MAYNNITSRTDSASLIPEDVVDTVITLATEESAALRMFRRLPVSRAQLRIPILSALPTAYWVAGDTGLKQTTQVSWANKFLNVEELAVIMPVPNNVLDDVAFNVWDEAMPLLTEAIGRALDAAIFFGAGAPGTFPMNVMAGATAAGNTVTEGADAAHGGFMGDVDNLVGLIEADGYDVSGYIAARSTRSRFRTARNSFGDRVDRDRLSGDLAELDGDPIAYTMRGLWPAGLAAGQNARMFAGEWASQFVIGVRKDITMDISGEAVIQDNTGAIVYNLFQQDMTAVRLTFRAGWQVANVINHDQSTTADRYPAAVLVY